MATPEMVNGRMGEPWGGVEGRAAMQADGDMRGSCIGEGCLPPCSGMGDGEGERAHLKRV